MNELSLNEPEFDLEIDTENEILETSENTPENEDIISDTETTEITSNNSVSKPKKPKKKQKR